jgi:inorganic pyrophosphatase
MESSPEDSNIDNICIDIFPYDLNMYEFDKKRSFIRKGRPQESSFSVSNCQGFIPKMLPDGRSAKFARLPTGHDNPLEICVLGELPDDRSDILMGVRVIGGLCMVGCETKDIIIAVIKNDAIFRNIRYALELPIELIKRIDQFLITYKRIISN